ncbi:MAG: ATP-binding protein [Nitrospirota bacterium]
MFKSLWVKFLILLIIIAMIGLSSAFLLRELMIHDFREYLEGEMVDRIYRVIASIESSYEKYSGWNEENITENTVWASMLGIEIKLYDTKGALVMDTEKAINKLSPLVKKRVLAVSEKKDRTEDAQFTPYTLFIGGEEIGHLEIKPFRLHKENVFIRRSNRFLLFSLLVLGGIAVFLGILFSRRLTKPIKELTSASSSIAGGNLRKRVTISGNDEIGKLSDAFNKMAHALETQESLKKKLTANIAHELRTPISAIRGELEGMIDGLIPAEKENIQSLYNEIGRLRSILEGIEEISLAESSSLSIKKSIIELKPFLKNITDRFSKVFMDKGVELELQGDDRITINADPDKLSQIIINLLTNALKATGNGGKILIRVSQDESGTDIEIADTGCGVKESDLPFIFERFYKAAEGGLGIGLTIVKELVESHGGKISVQSIYGKGTSFKIYFPL